MTFAIVEIGPVFKIATQVNLFCGPETGFVFFILFPYFGIVDREDYEPVLVFFQQDFIFNRHNNKNLQGLMNTDGKGEEVLITSEAKRLYSVPASLPEGVAT
jgi:hypothetical protein